MTNTLNQREFQDPQRVRELRSVAAGFRESVEANPNRVAVRSLGDEVSWTYSELRDRVDALAGGLVELGVERGDVVALMFTNRPDFYVADLAANTLGATTVSIYNTLTVDQIAFVLQDSGAKVAVVEEEFAPGVVAAKPQSSQLESIVVLEGASGPETLAWDDITAMAREFDPAPYWQSVETDDILTLIYTSGTTGPPKGVQLTNLNVLVTVAQQQATLKLTDGATGISWLPAAHIAERQGLLYFPMLTAGEVTTCPNAKQLGEYIQSVRPHAFFAVPRIWEKLRASVEASIAGELDKQRQIAAGIEKLELEIAGEPVPSRVAADARAGERELFGTLRASLGFDRAEALLTGAAATPRDTLIFFAAIGLPILETWGMSETCGAACQMPAGRIKFGSVGPVVDGGEVSLADDGELLFRGDQIMAGYRNQPEKTAETIDGGGWLHSGDLATIDEDGYVSIIGRKKEIIISAGGKNMSPVNIESAVTGACTLVGQCVAIGDGRPYNTALITLDDEAAAAWAKSESVSALTPHELAGLPALRDVIQAGVDAANDTLSRVEQIKRFAIVGSEWQVGGEELTPTMKLKRGPIAAKYADVIDSLYAAKS